MTLTILSHVSGMLGFAASRSFAVDLGKVSRPKGAKLTGARLNSQLHRAA